MAELTWEKQKTSDVSKAKGNERLKFLIGGILILGAVIYLIVSGTAAGARYFITVEELLSNPEYIGQSVRISGAVDGDTIKYDKENLIIDFTIANIPEQFDDLALTLHNSLLDPNVARLDIHIDYHRNIRPDTFEAVFAEFDDLVDTEFSRIPLIRAST